LDDVSRIRDRIDELDQEIVRLLKSRYENAKTLGRIKSLRGLEYRDLEREREILRKMERNASSLGLDPKFITPIFERIFSFSVQAQKDQSEPASKTLDGTRILVIGGTGNMGRLFARFLALLGAEVKLAGREISKTQIAAKELEVKPGSILDARSSDIVVLSVPMEETVRVAAEVSSIMREGSLLVDLSSVKTGISDRIAEKIPENLEYVSMHPLFGPKIDYLDDQTIIVTSYRGDQKWSKLSRALQRNGLKLAKMSAGQHDKAMAYAQGLHHFAMLSLGLSLDGMGGEPRTQSLRETEDRIASLLTSWETIVGVQQLNPFVPAVRQKFLDDAAKLAETRSKQTGALKKRIASNVQKWTRKL